MTFNDDAKLSGRGVRKSGRRTGIAVGGGGLGLVALFLISQFLGFDLSSLAGGDGSSAPSDDTALTGCYTGEDANENVECR
ncbi:MAG TPA: neutral zinc metallopeptidase, partial [Glaciihabitans sp.]|nr:neutral zinc metallopeptidase [Glaciihabitans sp.]